MVRQSCLRDRTVPVIADTRVVINLNATKCAETILEALPNPFLVVSEVVLELESGLQNRPKRRCRAQGMAYFGASANRAAWGHWDAAFLQPRFRAGCSNT